MNPTTIEDIKFIVQVVAWTVAILGGAYAIKKVLGKSK